MTVSKRTVAYICYLVGLTLAVACGLCLNIGAAL